MSHASKRVKAAYKRHTSTAGPAHPHFGESLRGFARRIALRNDVADGGYTSRHWAAVWLRTLATPGGTTT